MMSDSDETNRWNASYSDRSAVAAHIKKRIVLKKAWYIITVEQLYYYLKSKTFSQHLKTDGLSYLGFDRSLTDCIHFFKIGIKIKDFVGPNLVRPRTPCAPWPTGPIY